MPKQKTHSGPDESDEFTDKSRAEEQGNDTCRGDGVQERTSRC